MARTPKPEPTADDLIDAMAPPELEERAIFDDGDAPTVLEDWTPIDLDNATWAARHLARREQKIARVRAIAAEQRFRADLWEQKELEALERDRLYFETRLKMFHELALETDPKALTLRLPDGTELRSQAGKLAVTVEDFETFAAWVEMHELATDVVDDFGNVTQKGLLKMADPTPALAEIAKVLGKKAAQEKNPGTYPAVTDDGETVPGVVIERRARTFTVSTDTSPDA